MTGYEKSPDYGGGDLPPWAPWVVVVVVAAIIAGIAWLGHSL